LEGRRIRLTSEFVYWRSGKILLYLVIFRSSVEDLGQLVKRMKQIVEYKVVVSGGAYDEEENHERLKQNYERRA